MSKSNRYQESFDDYVEDESLCEFEDDNRHGRESHRRNLRRKIEDYTELRRLKRDCESAYDY